MRRLFAILSAICLVLCMVTAASWALSGMGYQRAFITARWQDRGISIDLHLSAFGWRESRLINGDLDYHWRADAVPSLDSTRQMLLQKFGQPNQATRRWSDMPEFRFMAMGTGGSSSQGGGYLYDVPLSSLTLVFAFYPLTWLMWQLYRKRKKEAHPGAIKCQVCGYDMRATPDRCPECGSARK